MADLVSEFCYDQLIWLVCMKVSEGTKLKKMLKDNYCMLTGVVECLYQSFIGAQVKCKWQENDKKKDIFS